MSFSVPIIGALTKGLIDLGKEFVVDKDKQIEFAYKGQELLTRQAEALLASQTTPKVDAFVKLLIAFERVYRPLMGIAMTCFGIWAHLNPDKVSLGDMQWIFDGAFPAWGVSRHINKQKKLEKQKAVDYEEDPRGWND